MDIIKQNMSRIAATHALTIIEPNNNYSNDS